MIATLVLGASASPARAAPRFEADVVRFHSGTVPTGQTIQLKPMDASLAQSLEFTSYANQLGQKLEALGFKPAASGAGDLIGEVRYTQTVRAEPREAGRSPVSVGVGVGGGAGNVGVSVGTSFGLGTRRDPPGRRTTTLELRLKRASDGAPVWEGRAIHDGRDGKDTALSALMPRLIDAMLVDFPGPSGQTSRYRAPRNR